MKRLRRLAIFFLAASFFAPRISSYAQAASQKQESADKADTYTWDLGQVKQNTVIKRSFNLQNTFGRLLHITGINTSCSCTGTEVRNKTLLPGQGTEVAVTFNSRGYSPGPLRQYIYVNTDDPQQPVLKITLRSEIVK